MYLKNSLFIFLMMIILLVSCSSLQKNAGIQIGIITGGHDFEKAAFLQIFDSFDHITYTHLKQPLADDAYDSKVIQQADVLLFYDMWQEISDMQKVDFLNLLKQGKPMIFIHHSIASYQNWGEFNKIRGGVYHLDPYEKEGVQIAGSSYKHDEMIPVKILDQKHPITEGIDAFTIRDEVYGNLEILTDVHPVMGTDHPENSPLLVWTTAYEKSRIVYIQFGHDHHAYADPHYRKILFNTIHWLSR